MCSRVPLAAQVNVTAASILVMLIVRAIKCSELELVKVAKRKSQMTNFHKSHDRIMEDCALHVQENIELFLQKSSSIRINWSCRKRNRNVETLQLKTLKFLKVPHSKNIHRIKWSKYSGW